MDPNSSREYGWCRQASGLVGPDVWEHSRAGIIGAIRGSVHVGGQPHANDEADKQNQLEATPDAERL